MTNELTDEQYQAEMTKIETAQDKAAAEGNTEEFDRLTEQAEALAAGNTERFNELIGKADQLEKRADELLSKPLPATPKKEPEPKSKSQFREGSKEREISDYLAEKYPAKKEPAKLSQEEVEKLGTPEQMTARQSFKAHAEDTHPTPQPVKGKLAEKSTEGLQAELEECESDLEDLQRIQILSPKADHSTIIKLTQDRIRLLKNALGQTGDVIRTSSAGKFADYLTEKEKK